MGAERLLGVPTLDHYACPVCGARVYRFDAGGPLFEIDAIAIELGGPLSEIITIELDVARPRRRMPARHAVADVRLVQHPCL